MSAHPQLRAADPALSAFVAANAGSGKTKTLVERVARLLLHQARPETILCVTYTKAAAAEMQRRLYETLGGWSVLDDASLRAALCALGETTGDLSVARTLFARALETPGGLKIQTLHAFCEKLLQRFPLEAGVSPGFQVMEDAAASLLSARARERLARHAGDHPEGEIARAYAHFAVELDLGAFEGLLKTFETERGALAAFIDRWGGLEGALRRVDGLCGFTDDRPDPEDVETAALEACDWGLWRWAAQALLLTGKTSDAALGGAMARLAEAQCGSFSEAIGLFFTDKGDKRSRLATQAAPPAVKDFLLQEQARLHDACSRARAARVARNTRHALRLAQAYGVFHADEKARLGGLDFADLIEGTRRLLTVRQDAAWVLYKLDGGIDHVLLDEAQDTSPDQWEILEALTGEFFAGDGSRPGSLTRTLFAVGDEKQSIFSFQGADPDQLRLQTQRYARRAEASEHPFAVVPLMESWRSAPEVLALVDEVFLDPSTQTAVPPAVPGGRVAHEAVRPTGHGGVDLWPLFRDEPKAAPEAWDAPQDATSAESAQKRLARRIAAEVRTILACQSVTAKGDPLRPEPRQARPGDVLVLVRRRGALFEEIIRALKRAGTPVAGADRLKLSDHVVFADILSLVRVCLYPQDDLSLAEVLRSPFCSVDEEGLYDLAHGRPSSLWRSLAERAGERPAWEEARAFLVWARQESRRRAPFDFLGRVMARLDLQGRSMRQRLLTRLGREADDALSEVMAQTLAAEERGVRDLERLATALQEADLEVKRELDSENGGFVRVMTVHGAKGLEAPVVFLPDTTARPPPNRSAFLPTPDGSFLLVPKESEDCPASAEARALAKRRAGDEQLRLFYVALTRARDRLVVAGRLSAREKEPPEGSWYQRAAEAFERLGARALEEGGQTILRCGCDPAAFSAPVEAPPAASAPPAWLALPLEAEAVEGLKAPSALDPSGRSGAPSPLASSFGLGRFRRGELIHKLLQVLPDVPSHERPLAARRLMGKESALTEAQREEMIAAALGVLDDERFAAVFGPGSRAEVSLAGYAPSLPAGQGAAGRVDRMVIGPSGILVVDFKTNRPSPERPADVDPAYLRQLAIYVALLRAIFPDRPVEAALIWTDGPKLMPIPEELLAGQLGRLAENN